MNALLDRELIERARAIDILSAASRYGARLRKAGGGEFVGPCPRCSGRDRFSVNVRKGIWNCRGCTKGGDVIALVQHLTGIDFAEAIELLTGKAWPAPQLAETRQRREHVASVRVLYASGTRANLSSLHARKSICNRAASISIKSPTLTMCCVFILLARSAGRSASRV